MDHQAVVEQMLVEILGKLREQSAEIASISARLDRPVAAKEAAAGAACDACGTDITDKARILLADGRIICGMCTQVLASQKNCAASLRAGQRIITFIGNPGAMMGLRACTTAELPLGADRLAAVQRTVSSCHF
jgi:hypothetical protein